MLCFIIRSFIEFFSRLNLKLRHQRLRLNMLLKIICSFYLLIDSIRMILKSDDKTIYYKRAKF